MKKLSLLLAIVLVFSFSVLSHAQYIDGTYEAWSDARQEHPVRQSIY